MSPPRLQGALVLVLVAGLFVTALRQELPEPDTRALAFATLVAANLGHVLVNRTHVPPISASLGLLSYLGSPIPAGSPNGSRSAKPLGSVWRWAVASPSCC